MSSIAHSSTLLTVVLLLSSIQKGVPPHTDNPLSHGVMIWQFKNFITQSMINSEGLTSTIKLLSEKTMCSLGKRLQHWQIFLPW